MKGIPLFITSSMKQKLHDMGFVNEVIGKMKPEDAHKIINEKLSQNDYLFKKIKVAFDQIMIHELVSDISMN